MADEMKKPHHTDLNLNDSASSKSLRKRKLVPHELKVVRNESDLLEDSDSDAEAQERCGAKLVSEALRRSSKRQKIDTFMKQNDVEETDEDQPKLDKLIEVKIPVASDSNSDSEMAHSQQLKHTKQADKSKSMKIPTERDPSNIYFMKLSPHANLLREHVEQMLKNYQNYVSYEVDYQPEAGCFYIYDEKKTPLWKNDGYAWKNNGNVLQPKAFPKYRKSFHIAKTVHMPEGDKRFQKFYYRLLSNPSIILVHYSGDHTIYVPTKAAQRTRTTRTPVKSESAEEQIRKERSLTEVEAIDILENYEGHISMSRAVRPKGGEIYLFDEDQIGGDWKCDGYMWRNNGTRYLPAKNPVLRKLWYYIRNNGTSGNDTSKEFRKIAYNLVSRPNIIMVHYMGDETVFKPRPHGNAKKKLVEYQRTPPTVMSAIKKAAVFESSNPKEVLKKVTDAGYEMPEHSKIINNVLFHLRKAGHIPKPNKNIPKMVQPEKEANPITYQSQVVGFVPCNEDSSNEETDTQWAVVDSDMNNITVELEPQTENHAASAEGPETDVAEMVQEDTESVDKSPLTTVIPTVEIKDKELIMKPLDPRPEVCKIQMEILKQQKANLKLQEKKLRLEILKLEAEKQAALAVARKAEMPSRSKSLKPSMGQEENLSVWQRDVHSTIASGSEQNVVYVENVGGFGRLASHPNSSEQIIYLQEASEYEITNDTYAM